MGSSAKRKKEKQKDFQVGYFFLALIRIVIGSDISQKPKLKVGKTKAKPENFTDTSFRSKGMG